MKIWLLTSEFPPDYGGGISTYCLETAQMFSLFGHEVTVITQNFQLNEISINKKDGYRVCYFNPDKSYTTSFLGYEANLSYAFAQVVKELVIKEGKPDMIESQEYMGIAYYLLQYKWLLYPEFKDLKVVITLHSPSFLYLEYNKVPYYQLPYFWIGEMERSCIRSADMLISPSQYLVDELKSRMKTDDLKINILKNPLAANIGQWSVVSGQPSLTTNIVFFGKLIPQKGCLELLSYFKELWNEGFEYPLTMIGGGAHLYHPEGMDMLDFIKKLCKEEIKNGKLKLLGSIPPQELNKYIANATAIIIPSIVDNLPYTVPEVMSKGKVVLASKQGGQSEIIENGVDGFLFDHSDSSSFKNQLKHIISLSKETLNNIGEKAFHKVQKEFGYKNIYNQKIELLENVEKPVRPEPKIFPFIAPSSLNTYRLPLTTEIVDEDLLSVVIPYYNMGKYVEETIQSILGSTYKKLEIILVNDGSTGEENTKILNGLSEKYKVKIINKVNEGLALARNEGAKHANGKYLAFLDPDDTIETTYYEKAIHLLKQYENVSFIGCWAKYFGDATGYWPAFNPEPPYLLVHNMINSSALVYKKAAFLNAGLNDPDMIYGMEDYESVISMVEKGYRGVALPETLWNYRIRKNSMARAFTNTKQIYLYNLIAEKHRNFYATFAVEVTNLLNANGPGFKYDNPTLFYNLPGSRFISNKIRGMVISKIKSNKVLRKVAIKIKKSL